MQIWKLIAVALLILAALPASAASEKMLDADRDKLLKLAAALSSEDYVSRDKAEDELRKTGVQAFSLLNEAYHSSRDAEQRERLRRVLMHFCLKLCTNSTGHKVTLSLDEKPMRVALTSLAEQIGLPTDALQFIAADPEQLIGIQLTDMEDRYALRWVLRLCGIEPDVELPIEENVYDVKDLPLKPQDIMDVLKNHCCAEDFAAPDTSAEIVESQLKVNANADGHERISTILKQLRQQKDQRYIRVHVEDAAPRKALIEMLARKTVSFDFVDMPLTEAVAFIQKMTSVPLPIDSEALKGEPRMINLRVTEMGADLTLDWILKLTDLHLSYKEQALYITKARATPPERELLVLDVSDLIAGECDPDHLAPNPTISSISDMIRNRVRPDTWDAALGTFIEERDEKLVIMQMPEVSTQIFSLLKSCSDFHAMMRKVEPHGKWPRKPLKPEDVPVEKKERRQPEPWIAELREKLQKKLSFDAVDVPLDEKIAELAKDTDTTIIIDPKVAAEGGNNTPITLRVKDMPAELALKWVLRLADLEYDFRDKAVFVTKRANLVSNVELELYYVRDLFSMFKPEDLQMIIKDRLMPAEFSDPTTSIAESGGILLVMQTPEIHAHILSLLTYLRTHPDDAVIPLDQAAGLTKMEPDLQKKLAAPVACDLQNANLEQVVKKLQELSTVTIVLGGVRVPKQTINLKLNDKPLSEVLKQALAMFTLTYDVRKGAIEIVPVGEDFSALECKLYRLDGIPEEKRAGAADIAHEAVAPEKWGAGLGRSIEELGGCLLVVQTPDAHEQIQAALQKLRAAGK